MRVEVERATREIRYLFEVGVECVCVCADWLCNDIILSFDFIRSNFS